MKTNIFKKNKKEPPENKSKIETNTVVPAPLVVRIEYHEDCWSDVANKSLDEIVKAVRAGSAITIDMTGSMGARLASHGERTAETAGFITGNFTLDYEAGVDPIMFGTLNLPIGQPLYSDEDGYLKAYYD